MPHLLIVMNPEDQDARLAAGVLLSALGPGRKHRADLPLPPLRHVSVLFVGAPSAAVLASTHAQARAVAVVATHAAQVVPPGVLWASGPTLLEAARRATGG